MSVERLSKTLAYVTCFYCFSLFATAMGLAAVNVAGMSLSPICKSGYCYTVAGRAVAAPGHDQAMGVTAMDLTAVKVSEGCKMEIAKAPAVQKL
jgi:hypothetical protein